MEVIAQTKFVRQTPRKLRLVANEVRGLKALEGEIILKNLNKKAARLLLKTLRQGMANAENNFNLKKEDLKIKKLEIGEGPRMKRYRFVAKGRVHQILKKMAHIKIVLESEEKKTTSVKTKQTKKSKGKKNGTKN
jgi:large subunit ribosomal protein L22